MDRCVSDLLKRSAAIPSMPQVAARFLEIVQDPAFDLHRVVDVLSADPGTASEVLRLANSPLFGVARRITSLAHALTLLGLKRVRSLVLGRYIVESIDHIDPPAIDTAYYWRRSLATAVLSARLAEVGEPGFREEAFISGLLADIGVVILDEALPEPYRPIAQQYRPYGQADLAPLESATLGIHHGDVSALVLEHWHLPSRVCHAVRWHTTHRPDTHDKADALARIVGSADRIAKYLCEDPEDLDPVIEACQRAMADVGLEPDLLAGILVQIEPQIVDFASLLRIDVVPSTIYTTIAQKLHEHLTEPAGAVSPR